MDALRARCRERGFLSVACQSWHAEREAQTLREGTLRWTRWRGKGRARLNAKRGQC